MFKLPPIPSPPVAEGIGGARKRLAELLIVLRAPDPPGSFAALAEEQALIDKLVSWPGEAPEELWQELVERLQELAEAQRCIRCGTCCRVSSPTLYKVDLGLVTGGHIEKSRLFTLRAGELVHSARLDERIVLESEVIKMRERPTGGCMFLDDHLCSDYEHRPLQCSHLECWSGKHGGDLEDEPRLTRRHLFADDKTALALIDEYDRKLPLKDLNAALDEAREGDAEAAQRALEFIELDHRLRTGISKKYGYTDNQLELLIGRDAVEVVRSQGLVINLDDETNPRFKTR